MSSIQQIYVKGTGGQSRQTLESMYTSGVSQVGSFDYRLSRHNRNAWVVTCREWIGAKEGSVRFRYIPLFVNPSSVSWSIPLRETVTKTAAGVVRNTWRNRYRGTYFDEFTLNITFQSGNIMPSAPYFGMGFNSMDDFNTVSSSPQPPAGLLNFYRFLYLLDRPKLLGAWENRQIIILHSRIFPVMRLEGFFTGDGINWVDQAESGSGVNQVIWNSTFQVYRTYPKISSAAALETVYKNWLTSEGLSEATPMHRQREIQNMSNVFNEGVDTVDGSQTLQTQGSFDELQTFYEGVEGNLGPAADPSLFPTP